MRIGDTINFLWSVLVVMAFGLGLWLGGTITERKMEAKYERLLLGSGEMQAGTEPGLPGMPDPSAKGGSDRGRRDKTE